MIRNIEENHEVLRERCGGEDQQGRPSQAGGPIQLEFESASASKTSMP
jgi:hypothetical protein